MLATILSDRGFVTQVAADGLEALETLNTFNPDVIVADLIMPRMDGFELLRQLKERGDLTPAIVLTAFGSIEKVLSVVHDLKAFWFLEKPVNHARSRSFWNAQFSINELCIRRTSLGGTWRFVGYSASWWEPLLPCKKSTRLSGR